MESEGGWGITDVSRRRKDVPGYKHPPQRVSAGEETLIRDSFMETECVFQMPQTHKKATVCTGYGSQMTQIYNSPKCCTQ